MSKKRINILSIDGGGVRGIIPAKVLAEIERLTGKRISQLFDLVAGTSTGGLIALTSVLPDSNGKPKYTAEQMVTFYENLTKEIFTRTPRWKRFLSVGNVFKEKYSSKGREAMAKDFFGNAKLKDVLTEVLITSYEIELSQPFFFKRCDARKNEMLDFYLAEVGQATCAAPAFFSPFIIKKPKDPLVTHYAFVDGGVVANSPAMCAYAEAKTLFPDADEYLVLSLGTGDYINRILLETSKGWGAAQWINPLLKILVNGTGDIIDHQLRAMFNSSGDKLTHYFRLQLRLHEDEMPTDDVRDLQFHVLKLLAENFINDNKHEIEKISEILIKY